MSSANVDLIWLLIGLGAFLAFASAIGFILSRRPASASAAGAIENLNSRIKAWWVMVAAIGLALLWGKTGVCLLFALCSFAALREFVTLTDTRGSDHWALATAFFVVLPVQYYLVWINWYGLYSIFIPVYGFLLLPIVAVIFGDTKRFLIRIAEVQWALMVCVFCISHVPALLSLNIPGYEGRNILLIGFLVIVVQGSDVMQFVWGKLMGSRRIAPNLSPSKTVEGLVGGAASAMLLGMALVWITPFSLWQAALMSIVIVLMGFFGGLVMSAIKRDKEIKDWGHLIAGHGGFLDRLDSVIFSAPVFFHLTRYGWSVA